MTDADPHQCITRVFSLPNGKIIVAEDIVAAIVITADDGDIVYILDHTDDNFSSKLERALHDVKLENVPRRICPKLKSVGRTIGMAGHWSSDVTFVGKTSPELLKEELDRACGLSDY